MDQRCNMLNTPENYFSPLQSIALYVTVYTRSFISFPKYLFLKSAIANKEWKNGISLRLIGFCGDL